MSTVIFTLVMAFLIVINVVAALTLDTSLTPLNWFAAAFVAVLWATQKPWETR